MKYSFFLKKPQRDKSGNQLTDKTTLIIFTCYFKSEARQFKYSTGENIKPSAWNFKENRCTKRGMTQTQLNRYSEAFEEAEALCIRTGEDLTSKVLRSHFDKEFKKIAKGKGEFFEAYELFMDYKQEIRDWSPNTVKRYTNIKNILTSFEKDKKYKLTFGKINQHFYAKFLDYCYTDLDHYGNTVARNVGLFKTFLNWALKERYTYNEAFKEFVKPKTVITDEVALTLKQVEDIFSLEIESEAKQKVRDVFVFQCLVGMRYGELKLINKNNVNDYSIRLKEEKNSDKEYRDIPLFDISRYILKKYDYELPLISEQKQNKYIKEILKAAGWDEWTEYSRIKGKDVEKFTEPFYKRIGTHSARRTFITILKGKGIPDKDIMKITGHTDTKSLNIYYKVSDTAGIDAVEKAFGSMKLPKLKAV